MDVMFYEVFREEEEALRRYLPDSIQASFTVKTIQAYDASCIPAPLISVRTQSIIPPAWGSKLKGILSRSTGYDHLTAYRKACGCDVACGYLPVYCTRAVAEHALLMILALSRKLKKQMKQFEIFRRDDMTGHECLGRRLLVVGVGNIGSQIVQMGKALGMRVRGVDLVCRVQDLEYVPLEKGMAEADIIVSALPLTDLTRGMFHRKLLEKAPSGALFVNIGRGEISPSRDLKSVLDQGILGGVALDIYEDEGILSDWLRSGEGDLTENGKIVLSLKEHENVLLTPHNAFNTEQALERKSEQSAEAVEHFLRLGNFPYPIP